MNRSFEFELNFKNKQSPFTRLSIFLFTFIMVFFLTVIQNLWFKNFTLLSPLPFKNSTIDKILPKLEEKPNNFKLKNSTVFVEPSFAFSQNYESLNAYAAIDYNTGEVLIEKNLSKKLPIASLTKIMSAIISLDLVNPDEKITISKSASLQEPTTIGVVPNQKMTVEDLLNAALLTSANDAAQALKDGIDNKFHDKIFVNAMNAKAKFLGLKNTNFSNPQGFDSPNNFSSVEDLTILARYAIINYPSISGIVKKDYQFIPKNKDHKQFDLYNWNGLLGVYPGVEGIKIGNTDAAGYTTIVVSERQGKKVIAVVLGAPGVLERDLWASQILDEAFNKLSNLPPVGINAIDLHHKYSTWKYWN